LSLEPNVNKELFAIYFMPHENAFSFHKRMRFCLLEVHIASQWQLF